MPPRPHGKRPLTDAHRSLLCLLAEKAVADFLAEEGTKDTATDAPQENPKVCAPKAGR